MPKINYKNNKSGFTLIELLIVIAIIGLLSSFVLAGVLHAKAKARDSKRMTDLETIKKALIMYYHDKGNWIETGSGCGYNGNGGGFFNYEIAVQYPKSIAHCLMEGGYLGGEVIDPTGGRSSTSTSRFAYMKYSDLTAVYLYAKLETVPQSTTATDGTPCGYCDSDYGMNYYLKLIK